MSEEKREECRKRQRARANKKFDETVGVQIERIRQELYAMFERDEMEKFAKTG
jgi:hypothetical protein